MDYTLSNVHEKIKQFVDKVGSDYFPLPIILNFFETSTYDFVGERLKHIEKTQEITDDISNLIIPGGLIIGEVPSFDINAPTKYAAAIPADYYRLVSYDVYYADGSRCRRADLLRQAEYNAAKINTNKEPTKHYPIILQENNLFQVDAGVTVPTNLRIMYCKKPSFATTGESTIRIVNLPDEAIEKILYKTVMNLFNKTADERIKTTAELEQSYRKVFR